MKKYPLYLIEKIKMMRTEGKTLGDIVRATGLPKTTVYFHIRKIPKQFNLTKRLKEIIRVKNRKIGDAKRGKSFKIYPYKKPNMWTPDFVMLVAHLMFDGELKYASCVYNNRSQSLIDRFIRLMKENIGVTDYKFHKKHDGVNGSGHCKNAKSWIWLSWNFLDQHLASNSLKTFLICIRYRICMALKVCFMNLPESTVFRFGQKMSNGFLVSSFYDTIAL